MAGNAVKTGLVGGFMQTDLSAAGFSSLGLSSLLTGGLEERNITIPTGIQRKVITRLLQGESFLFRSATGTGKTFAYLLPFLQKLFELLNPDISSKGENLEDKGKTLRGKPLLLILAPTFELCSQIKTEADFLLRDVPIHTALLIGSAAMGRQIEALKKDRPEVIIGNPGRILALARQRKLKLTNVRFLVLDEGDRLVQEELFGESAEVVALLKDSSLQRTGCSATIPAKSRERLLSLLGIPASPGSVEEDDSLDVLREKVEHWAFYSPEREKLDLLRSLIAALERAKGKKKNLKALIFTSRSAQVEMISARLKAANHPAAGLSGVMDKTRREQCLENFRSGQIRFLVSTDLAARGLDITDISHIIALDVSEDRDVYIHRSGRTARAGKGGVMVSIGTEGEMRRLATLEKNMGITVFPKVLYGGRILSP